MKKSEFYNLIREVIVEAKEEKKAEKKDAKPAKKSDDKKSVAPKKAVKKGNKLVDMKARLTGLKKMSEQLSASTLSEVTEGTEGTNDYPDLQKYASELDKIKQSSDALSQKLKSDIEALETNIQSEVGKIKEMIGLTAESGQTKVVDEDQDLDSDDSSI